MAKRMYGLTDAALYRNSSLHTHTHTRTIGVLFICIQLTISDASRFYSTNLDSQFFAVFISNTEYEMLQSSDTQTIVNTGGNTFYTSPISHQRVG